MNQNEQIRNEIIELFLDEKSEFQREHSKTEKEIEKLFKDAYRNVAYLALKFYDSKNAAIDLYRVVYGNETTWCNEIAKDVHLIAQNFLNTIPSDKLKLEQIKSEIALVQTKINVMKLTLNRVINQKKIENDGRE